MSSEDLIVIEGRATRASGVQRGERDSSFDADRTFQNHAREDVLELVKAVRNWQRHALTIRSQLVLAAQALVEYSDLYGELDQVTANRIYEFARALEYDGPLDPVAVRNWIRKQRA